MVIMEKLEKLWECLIKASENQLSGIFFAVMSTILLALGHFQAQLAIQQTTVSRMSPFEVVLVRSIEQAVMLLPFILVYRSRVLFGSDKWLHIFLMSLAGYLCYILLYIALQYIPLSIALAISATCPFFATAFSICILKERTSYLEITCAFVSLIGVIFAARPSFIFGKHKEREVIDYKIVPAKTHELIYFAGCGIALIFGVARALYLVLVRKWAKESKESNSTQALTVFYPSILGCLFTPYLILFSGKTMVVPEETYKLFSMLSVGLLTSIGLVCLALALKSQNATIVGFIRNLEIVWAFILQYFVMNITPSMWSIGGSIIIILATMVTPFRNKIVEQKKSENAVEIENSN